MGHFESENHPTATMKVLLVFALACLALSAAQPHGTTKVQKLDDLFPGSCKFCTDVVDALETLIEDFGPDEQKIKEFAEGLCGHLIGKFVQEGCTKLVDLIVGYIDDNKAPETICSALPIAFCPYCKINLRTYYPRIKWQK